MSLDSVCPALDDQAVKTWYGCKGTFLEFGISALGPIPGAFSALEVSVSQTEGKLWVKYHVFLQSLPSIWRKENGPNVVARSRKVLP